MDSSCFAAGFSYISALGFGLASIVLSSWLVMLMRAVYREAGGFRSGLANATPLWVPGLAGIAALFPIGNSLFDWIERCIPATGWSAPGALIIGLGLALASVAVGRLIFGRVRVRNAADSFVNREATSPQDLTTGAWTTETGPPNLPAERRRVIVEYAVTYAVADLVLLIGIGLA